MTRASLLRFVLAALAGTLAAGCATTERVEAAGDVHALLISIRDDDRAAFDAHVDRVALEDELETKILARAQTGGDVARALGPLLARPLSQLAGQTLLQPEVFRAVAEYYGYTPATPIPSQLVIAGDLKTVAPDRVCATRRHGGPCVLTFAEETGVWRLVSFDGDASMLKLPLGS